MGIGIISCNHVNVTVPAQLEDAAKQFYGSVLGLTEIPKPVGSRQNMGAWYQLGDLQVHLSVEDGIEQLSERHVCYQVADIKTAESAFTNAGVELISDKRPVAGQSRFYVRDPGGNLLEIVQKTD